MAVNFEQLLQAIVIPLVVNPKAVVVKSFLNDDNALLLQINVHPDDLGRVIGKGGKIAQAIRTICYAGASKEGCRIHIDIESI